MNVVVFAGVMAFLAVFYRIVGRFGRRWQIGLQLAVMAAGVAIYIEHTQGVHTQAPEHPEVSLLALGRARATRRRYRFAALDKNFNRQVRICHVESGIDRCSR